MHRGQLCLGVGRHLQEPRRGVPSWVSPVRCSSSFFVTKRERVRRLEPVVHSNNYWLLGMVVRLGRGSLSVFEAPKHYGGEMSKDR
jgi:hypothetical protein